MGLRGPLQWAFQQKQLEIARLLIRHGACLAHVSAWGWTPAFYLWPDATKAVESMLNYLEIFCNDISVEWELFDTQGWAVLHRAAAFGTADEVQALIHFGASTTTCALPLRWTALHHAVFYGNLETFRVLVSSKYRTSSVLDPDARGWTLLHIAASAGHDDIVRDLLALGADHQALSEPYHSHMPEVLLNKRFRPGDAAAAQSRERYKMYITALKDFGLEIPLIIGLDDLNDEIDDDDDLFLDALEELST